jgi:hypothetical protein
VSGERLSASFFDAMDRSSAVEFRSAGAGAERAGELSME